MLRASVGQGTQWRTALWMPGERAAFHARMPPCEPGPNMPIVQGRYPRPDEIREALTRGSLSVEALMERAAIMMCS